MPQPLTVTLEGRTALVTGGGTGIGKACAGAMARLGAEVTIAGPHAAVLEQAADELSSDGAVRFVQADVTDEDQVAAAVDAAAGGGRLDIALANAGTGFPGSLLHLSKDHWMVPLGVNVLGTAFTIKHAAKKMLSGGGSIITVSSGASSRLTKFMTTYSVTKAAVDELTRAAAQELGPVRNPCQLHPPRVDRNRGSCCGGNRIQPGPRAGPDAAGPTRRSGRHHPSRDLSGVGSVRMGHRPAAQRLRWIQSDSSQHGSGGLGAGTVPRRDGTGLRPPPGSSRMSLP